MCVKVCVRAEETSLKEHGGRSEEWLEVRDQHRSSNCHRGTNI